MDDSVASVGNANFDHRSLELNFESNPVIYDKEFAQRIKSAYIHVSEQWCTELTTEEHLKRSWQVKVKEASLESTARSPRALCLPFLRPRFLLVTFLSDLIANPLRGIGLVVRSTK